MNLLTQTKPKISRSEIQHSQSFRVVSKLIAYQYLQDAYLIPHTPQRKATHFIFALTVKTIAGCM